MREKIDKSILGRLSNADEILCVIVIGKSRAAGEKLKTLDTLRVIRTLRVINGVAAALPHLKTTAAAHGQAHIISMCSASAIYGTPEHSTYSASKFAVRGLTEALNIELQREGIVVCDVLPSYVDTGMLSQQEQPSHLLTTGGLSHTPNDVAEMIWSAASSRRLHWFGNRALGMGDRLSRVFPGAFRWAFRRSVAQ